MPHLDYGGVPYDRPKSEGFWQKTENVQFNATHVITSAIESTSKMEVYNESGLEYSSLSVGLENFVYFQD